MAPQSRIIDVLPASLVPDQSLTSLFRVSMHRDLVGLLMRQDLGGGRLTPGELEVELVRYVCVVNTKSKRNTGGIQIPPVF